MYRRPFAANRNHRSFSRRPAQVNPALLVKKAQVVEENVFTPVNSFADFMFTPNLYSNIVNHGYTSPTPIQDKVIPEVLKGRDVVGIANTGTGKTAAFILPILQKISINPRKRALIIAPTRELAEQIEQEMRKLACGMNIYSILCIGGVSMYHQVSGLRRNPAFVIGTPGRLKDLERQRRLDMSVFTTIVLDEVDRMLDMGFIGDIKYLVSRLPAERQSLFFSATLPDSARGIMQEFLRNPFTVSVKTQETSKNVNQDIIRTNGKPKIDVLHDLLIKEEVQKALVFGRTKWGIEKIHRELEKRGFKAAALHGNKNQNQRKRALEMFKANKIQILLATDIASRGLDIDNVTHVINYDLPVTYEDYVHRIGRTGRANKTGTAWSFVD